jgi:hypothetical protein
MERPIIPHNQFAKSLTGCVWLCLVVFGYPPGAKAVQLCRRDTRTHQNQPPTALRKLVGFGVLRWVLVGFGWHVPKKGKKASSFSAAPGMFPNLNQPDACGTKWNDQSFHLLQKVTEGVGRLRKSTEGDGR